MLNCLSGQEFTVPGNYVLKVPADYGRYENDVLRGIDWIFQTPVDEQKAKRIEVNKFLMDWITGSPNVTIEINQEIMNFVRANPELLMIFLSGWTKHVLESRDNTSVLAGNVKGIESVIAFYGKNIKSLKKDPNVEQYARMKERGTLEKYIARKIEQANQ